jgi:hypothetical protein
MRWAGHRERNGRDRDILEFLFEHFEKGVRRRWWEDILKRILEK